MSKRARIPIGAYDRALRLLSIRDHAEVELRRKLRKAEHEPAEIDAAIERVRALGYLDDARFARVRASALVSQGRLGPRGVREKLRQAGVKDELVSAALSGAMEGRDELELARDLIARKHPAAIGSRDQKLRARAARFLASRGFSTDVIFKALRIVEE
jgi:regulatory protein